MDYSRVTELGLPYDIFRCTPSRNRYLLNIYVIVSYEYNAVTDSLLTSPSFYKSSIDLTLISILYIIL